MLVLSSHFLNQLCSPSISNTQTKEKKKGKAFSVLCFQRVKTLKPFWDSANHTRTKEWMLESSNLRQRNICLTAKNFNSLPHLKHCSFCNNRHLKSRPLKDRLGCTPKLGDRYQTSTTQHGTSPLLCANRGGYSFFSPAPKKQNSQPYVPETLALCCVMKYRLINLSFTNSISFSKSMEEGSDSQF